MNKAVIAGLASFIFGVAASSAFSVNQPANKYKDVTQNSETHEGAKEVVSKYHQNRNLSFDNDSIAYDTDGIFVNRSGCKVVNIKNR